MLTPMQRLRFVVLMNAGALALTLRDAVTGVLAPRSALAESHRAAEAFPSTFLSKTFLRTAMHRVEAQLAMPVQAPVAMVLVCHGIGERFYFWRKVQHLLAMSGIGSLVFHYPGYGRSTGLFTPENVDSHARSAYAYMHEQAPDAPLFVFGTSLGSAVAAHVAATLNPPPTGLIVAQGFTTLREAAKAVLRAAHLPVALCKLLPDTWRNTEALGATRCPVLIVHGAADELFPVEMGEELFCSAKLRPECSQLLSTPASYGHGDPIFGSDVEAYWQLILAFIERESSAANERGMPSHR